MPKYVFKVTYLPTTVVNPVYSPEHAKRLAEEEQRGRAEIERRETEMRERRAERERHQRRQTIIDNLKIIR
jgi:hypothetical protein